MKKFRSYKNLVQSVSIFFTLCLLFILFINFDNDKTVFIKDQNDLVAKASLGDASRKMPLYGFNGNNTKGPAWTNKTYRDSVASFHFKIIRYPGGNVANWWDWQKGWYTDNPSAPDRFKKMKSIPNGLKELKTLVEATNCDVVFNLNMISSTLDDQINMLTSAQSLNIPIKWVELGNEFNNQKNPGRQTFPNPEDYGKVCRQWIDAIKSHFQNAKVAVVGGDRNYGPDVKNWNDIVLKNAPNADALVAHLYPRKGNALDESGIHFQKLYNEFVYSFTNQGFNTVNKSIWVTEFNILWSAEDNEETGGGEPKQYTWAQALATLLMTSMTTSLSPNTTLILNHNISGVPIFSALETDKRTFRKLPNGIGMHAWLMASDDMDLITKINFKNDNKSFQDYEVFGWKFSNNAKSSILLVNLLNSPLKVDLSSIVNGNANFETKSADKNSVINSAADIKYNTGTLNNGSIELPAYSFTIIKTDQ
jgi:hypothetical protein